MRGWCWCGRFFFVVSVGWEGFQKMVQAHLQLRTSVQELNLQILVQELNVKTLVQELKTLLPKSPLRARAPGKEQMAERNHFHRTPGPKMWKVKSPGMPEGWSLAVGTTTSAFDKQLSVQPPSWFHKKELKLTSLRFCKHLAYMSLDMLWPDIDDILWLVDPVLK